MTIAVINYDQGNLFSIINALKFFNLDFKVTNKKTEIQNCSQILIPGVGAYDKTIKSLSATVGELKLYEPKIGSLYEKCV